MLVVEYFEANAPAGQPKTALQVFQTDLLGMANTAALLVQIFATCTLLLWQSRRVYRRTGLRRQIYSSSVFLAVFIFFMALGLSQFEKLAPGANYRLLYMTFIGTLTATATGIKFLHHAFWTFRLFAAVTTLESATLFIAWFLTYAREMVLTVALWPGFALIGDTIEVIPFSASSRALLLSTAVAAIIIAARALVGREPGLIDMEMVEK